MRWLLRQRKRSGGLSLTTCATCKSTSMTAIGASIRRSVDWRRHRMRSVKPMLSYVYLSILQVATSLLFCHAYSLYSSSKLPTSPTRSIPAFSKFPFLVKVAPSQWRSTKCTRFAPRSTRRRPASATSRTSKIPQVHRVTRSCKSATFAAPTSADSTMTDVWLIISLERCIWGTPICARPTRS